MAWRTPGYRVRVNTRKLLEYMIEHGMSKADMAKQMGVHRDVFLRAYRGERPPSKSFVKGILRLGLNVDEVIVIEEETPSQQEGK